MNHKSEFEDRVKMKYRWGSKTYQLLVDNEVIFEAPSILFIMILNIVEKKKDKVISYGVYSFYIAHYKKKCYLDGDSNHFIYLQNHICKLITLIKENVFP